jgi:Cu-Zn family superoxide dismutase
MAAGGHYDPANTGKHLGPQGEGHKGDLPALTVDVSGETTKGVVAPHLTVADIKGRSIIIHAGADNYSDQPAPLGGGGARIACAWRSKAPCVQASAAAAIATYVLVAR